jgi:hypothetical protein
MRIAACYDEVQSLKNSRSLCQIETEPLKTFDVLPATAFTSGVALFLGPLLQRVVSVIPQMPLGHFRSSFDSDQCWMLHRH